MSAGRYRVVDSPLQLDGKRHAPGKVVALEESDATDELVRIGAVTPVADEAPSTDAAAGKAGKRKAAGAANSADKTGDDASQAGDKA